MVITRAQRLAIKRIYDRCPLWPGTNERIATVRAEKHKATYREFRKTVQHGFDCLMVKWCGMWLGIEKDGYTHS